jgi:hypothetical protein
MDLVIIQRRALLLQNQFCMLKKMINICVDNLCMKLCKIHKISNCAFQDVFTSQQNTLIEEAVSNGRLNFKEPGWSFLTYLKWEFIEKALLLGAKYVLMVDVDILILKNPFVVAKHQVGNYDVLHQVESISYDCDTTRINSGLMIIKRTNNSFIMTKKMLANKSMILNLNNTHNFLEQEILSEVIKQNNITKCNLDYNLFTGHCEFAHIDETKAKKIATYHVHCVSSLDKKIALMTHFLNYLHVENITFNQLELFRNYFDEKSIKNDLKKPSMQSLI